MFWTRFIELCNEVGQSPNAVAAACGVKSSGTVTGWSKGASPRAPVLHKLAQYFHVSADYLAGKVNDPFFVLDDDRILRDINSYVDGDLDEKKAPTLEGEREIENPDIRMIARAGRKMTPEQAENLRKYAQYMFPEAFEE